MSARRHRFLLFLAALISALFAVGIAQAAPPTPPAAPVANVPSMEEAPDASTDEPEYRDPSHSPRVSKSEVQRPPVPAGYNTLRIGNWITFAYPPSVRQQVEPLAERAEEFRAELGEMLGAAVLTDVHIRIARTPGEMADLAPVGSPFPKYAAGVAYSGLGLVLLTVHPLHPNSHHDLIEVYRHELAHVALHDALDGRRVPRWFNEGFAVFASGEASAVRLQSLWTATVADDLIGLRELERSFPAEPARASVAYAEAADIVRYLLRTQDRDRFSQLLGRLRGDRGSKQTFESALRDSYGLDLAMLEYEWRQDVAKRYTFWPIIFSGSIVWVGMIGLFAVAWRKRRKRSKETLDRWEQEEAVEDARQRRMDELEEKARVRIVLPRGELLPEVIRQVLPLPDGEVPKVEHDGNWHTLH